MHKIIVASLALLAAAGAAQGAEVTVLNCVNDELVVRSYNQNDGIRMVAHTTMTLGARASGKIGCEGITFCQLEVAYGNVMRLVPVATFMIYVRKLDTSTGATIDLPSNC